MDFERHIKATERSVTRRPVNGEEVISVLLRRAYDAPVTDVWDALTDPDRLRRWFLPISGDLRVGGTFQLEGNAGGDILDCEPPRRLKVTFGGPSSLVEVRLAPDGSEGTVFELEHSVPASMAGSGAGALWVGPGWDGAFLALDRHLHGETPADPVAAASSPEAQEYGRRSVDAWVAAIEESGTATAEEIAGAKEVSLAQFAPDAPRS